MLVAQFAGDGVKARIQGHAGVAFAHHGLHEDRLEKGVVRIGPGKHFAQLLDVVGLHGHQVLAVAEGGQVAGIGLAAGVRIARGTLGAAVEPAAQRQAPDLVTRARSARVGHVLGVDVGDPPGHGDRLRARVHAQEAVEGAAVPALVANLAAQGVDQA